MESENKKLNLSIVVPVYNIDKYIGRCLDSILGQDIPKDEYEILVVDDGSTDSSSEIVRRYSAEYDNIVVFRQVNSGLSAARNLGIANTRGRYIYFVDGDDALLPNTLAKIYRLLFNSVDGLSEVSKFSPEVIAFKCEYSYSDEMPVYAKPETDIEEISYSIHSGVDYIAKFGYYNAVWLYIVSKELIDNLSLRFEPGKTAEDCPFTTEVYLAAKNLLFVDSKVYFYSYNAQSISRSKELKKVLRFLDGNVFASNSINRLMEKYADIPDRCKRVLVDRRDRMLLEALDIVAQRVDLSMIGEVINDLKAKKLYPIPGITKYADGSKIASLFYRLYNNRVGISLLNRIYWTRRQLTKRRSSKAS